jgi:hypothetical protein
MRVYVYAINVAVVAARINMVAVNRWYTSRAGKHNRSGSVVCKIPEFFAIGKVKTSKIITNLVIPVE